MIGGGGLSGGGGTAGAIRAGRAFVEFFAKDGELRTTLDRWRKNLGDFGKGLVKVGAGVGAAGGGILAPLLGAAKGAMDEGKLFNRLAERFGTTSEQVSTLAYAFRKAGVPAEDFGDTIHKLPQILSEAADGGGPAADMLRRLGINARDLVGLPLDKQVDAIADAVAGVANPADQSAVAMALLGRHGDALLPVLKKGSAGLKELAGEAERVGAVVSSDDAKHAAEASKALNLAWTALEKTAGAVGYALLGQSGELMGAANLFVDAARSVRLFVEENRPLVVTVAAVGAGLVGLGAALTVAGVGIVGTASVLGTVATAAGAVLTVTSAVAGFFLSWPGLAVVTIGVVSAELLALSGVGKDAAESIAGYWGRTLGTVKETWGGVSDALKAGDLSLAGKVALAGLTVEFRRAALYWQEVWNDFKAFFVDGWHDAVYLVQDLWLSAVAEIAKALVDLSSLAKDALGKQFDSIADVLKNIPGVSGAVVGALQAFGKASDIVGPEKLKGQIDADRDRRQIELTKQFQAEQAARAASRAGDLAGARGALGAAQEAFAHALAEAAAAAGKEAGGEKKFGAIGQGSLAPAIAARGQFSASALAQALGVGGGVAQRTLRETEKVAVNTKAASETLKEVSGKLEALVPTFG